MIVLVRKKRAALLLLLFVFSALLISINTNRNWASPVTNIKTAQKTVLLDPGHGGEDPGAVSDYSGIKEKDVNLNIALRVKELLEAEGYRVMMTRSEDRLEYQSDTRNIVQKRKEDLLRRKKLINESGADITVSIHLNKFPQTQYYGAQVFFPPQSPESQRLAVNLQKSAKELLDPNNKREALVKDTKPPIIILSDIRTTIAIIECGFLSNAEEEKKLGIKEYQGKVAEAIKQGIVNYFNK